MKPEESRPDEGSRLSAPSATSAEQAASSNPIVISYGPPPVRTRRPDVGGVIWHSMRLVFYGFCVLIVGWVLATEIRDHANPEWSLKFVLIEAAMTAAGVWQCAHVIRSIRTAWKGGWRLKGRGWRGD